MPIDIECEDCGNTYRVSDDKAGTKVKCRECGARIDVPDEDADLFESESSRKPSRGRKRRQDGPPAGVMIGIGAVVVVMIIGVTLFVVMGRGKNQQAANPLPNTGLNAPPPPAPSGPPPAQLPQTPAQANAGQPGNNPAGSQVAAGNGLPNSKPNSLPSSTPANGGLPNGGLPNSGLPKSGFNNPAGVDPTGGLPVAAALPGQAPTGKKFGGFAGAGDAQAPDAPAPDNWTVKVDPRKDEAKIDAAKPINLKFPSGARTSDVLYPETPSVFVAVGGNWGRNQGREVWNLATKAKFATVNADFSRSFDIVALSPDGQHMAASNGKNGILVWATKTNKALGELDCGGSVHNLFFPSGSRVVAFVQQGGGGTAKVYKLPSGDLEHELDIDKGYEPNMATASPGGQYLAVVTSKTSMKMFDLESGSVAGDLPLPYGDVFFAGKTDSIAFSQDGQELALIMPTGVHEKELLVVNVADGKQLARVQLNMKDLWGKPDQLKRNRLEWFPDRSRLLWRGHFVLDARTGGPVWMAPEEEGSDAPRRMISDKKILVVAGNRNNPMLVAAPVPIDEIAAAAKVVAEGGEASDAGMPTLAKADLSEVTPVATGAVGQWSMKPDGVEGAGKPVKGSIPIPKGRAGIGGVYIGRPSTGRAAAWYTDNAISIMQNKGIVRHQSGPASSGPGTCDVDVFDLANGKVISTIPVKYQSAVLDISPDCEAVAVKTSKPNEERIDVYSLAKGAHICGWRPFQEKQDFFKNISSAILIDSQYCVTSNAIGTDQKGANYLWKLPECKAVWRLENARNWCLSPGGRYLGFQTDSRYLFMEARTGELVGEVPVIMPNISCAFHPMGTHLAVLAADGVSHKITIVDVATGQSTADFFVPQGNEAVQWCGDTYLLLDGKWLVDLKQQKNGWEYNLQFGTRAKTQPDGRHWYIVMSNAFDQNPFISSAIIPEKSVADKLESTKLPDESLLKPGMTLGVQVNLQAQVPNRPNLANEVGDHFRKGLEKNGFVFGANGPFTLYISTTQSNPGEKMTFRGRFGMTTDVPVTNVNCEVALVSNGQAVWKNTQTVSNHTGPITFLKDGEDITTHVNNQMWNRVVEHLTKFPVPKQVFGATAGAGLGQSAFVAGGTQPGNR